MNRIEEALVKLVDWAHQAIEKSCNQPALPHVVDLLNKVGSRNLGSIDRWDPVSITHFNMNAARKALERNENFKEKIAFWTARHVEIKSLEALLHRYYSSVKLLRVPDLEDPELLERQISKLYDTISNMRRITQWESFRCGTRLDATELQLYLRNAFDHFAACPDKPFNFVKASFEMDAIGPDFDGILKLAVKLQPLLENHNGLSVWKETSRVIASCFILDAHRRGLKGLGRFSS